MASNLRKGLVIAAGAVTIAGSVSVVHLWRKLIRRRSEKLQQRIEDGISMEQLFILTKSPSVMLRRSAEQLLLDRITKPESFQFVLRSCRSDEEEQVLKACTVLCVILKSVDYRNSGMDKPILTTLASCLARTLNVNSFTKRSSGTSVDERIHQLSVAAIFDFVCDSEEKKELLLNETDCVASLFSIVQQTRSREVLRYAVFLLHQMANLSLAHGPMIRCGAVPVFAGLSVSQHGDNVLQKLCLQILIFLITSPVLQHSYDSDAFFKQIANQGVLIRGAVSLKSEDGELVYSAIHLLHEFAKHSSSKQYLYNMPYLLGNLQKALISNPAHIQRLILRVIAFMTYQHDKFKSDVLDNAQLMEHLPVCLASGEPDVVHWSSVLVHDLAVAGSDQEVADRATLEKLLGSSDDALIKAMIPLAVSQDHTMVRLMAETLGFICSCEQLHFRLVKAGMLSIILGLSMMQDSDLAFWSAALLLNLAMTSDDVKFAILKAGGLQALVELCLGDHENSQVTTMAAKTLVMLGFTEKPLRIHFHCDSESGSVNIHDKNFYLNHPGITVMIWDTLINDELICQNFNDLENVEEIPSELNLDVPCLRESGQNIGNLVFIVIKGKHCAAYLKGMEDILHFSEDTSYSGLTHLDSLSLPDNHMCAIVAQLTAPRRLDVWHLDKSDKPIDLQLQYNYGNIVNNRVNQLLLLPALNCIDGVPAQSPISRVSELELLEIFACDSKHLYTLRDSMKLVDVLTEMIWYCADKGFESLQSEPLAVAHCLGALRVLAVLTTHDLFKSEIMAKETASYISLLSYRVVHIWLALSGVSNISYEENNMGATPGTVGPRPVSRGDALATGGVLADELDGDTLDSTLESIQESFVKSQSMEDTISTLGTMVQQLAAQSTAEHSREPENTTAIDGAIYTELESESRTEDQQIMYTRVAKYSALILNNLASQQNPDAMKSSQIVLNKVGATYILWAVLLSSTDAFRNIISLPVCYTLTRLAATEFLPISDDLVVLNPDDKTSSLLISNDCLEVRNDTWTFESIRTNHCVPRTCDDKSIAGWYYEVLLMSNGIIQIGWATKDCQYGPEKGVGIGDYINSCAYDGARCKKWNGPVTENLSNDYGLEWCEGDIMSCLMDSSGNVSFWLRGVDMGVAFEGLDLSQGWYPACSVSSEQQLGFNFGDTPFRYGSKIPADFIPFCQVRGLKVKEPSNLTEQLSTENRNNNAEVSSSNIPTLSSGIDESPRIENQDNSSIFTSSTRSSIPPPIELNKSLLDDSTDEVLPVLSPDDDTSMAEFGYSGIQGEECADSGTAMEEPITDELFGEGGEEAYQPDLDDPTFQPMGAGDEESHDSIGPIGKQLYLSSAGEAGDENLTPSLYYEVVVAHSVKRPLVLGYSTMDGSRHVCAVVNTDDQIVLPDEALTQIPVGKNTTIGCGLLSPPGAIFFTIDGNPIRHLFSFNESEAGQTPLIPCTNNPYLKVNFGQEQFTYDPANQLEHRLGMAVLLNNWFYSI